MDKNSGEELAIVHKYYNFACEIMVSTPIVATFRMTC